MVLQSGYSDINWHSWQPHCNVTFKALSWIQHSICMSMAHLFLVEWDELGEFNRLGIILVQKLEASLDLQKIFGFVKTHAKMGISTMRFDYHLGVRQEGSYLLLGHSSIQLIRKLRQLTDINFPCAYQVRVSESDVVHVFGPLLVKSPITARQILFRTTKAIGFNEPNRGIICIAVQLLAVIIQVEACEQCCYVASLLCR